MKKQYGTHEKCYASRDRDGVVLICGRSAGHSVLKCWDPDEEQHFIAPERKGFPKIQPLGVRKLTPLASELCQALDDLRDFLEKKDNVDVRDVEGARRFLSSWVEGPMARALETIDPSWRAHEIDSGRPDPL